MYLSGKLLPKEKRVFFVIGPTSSGKSAFALALAKKYRGTIINADSMQVYRDLRILTARPDYMQELAVPHALYGVLGPHDKGNVAWWLRAVRAAIEACFTQGRLPILCGGTGMYFHALCHGLSQMPGAAPQARGEVKELLALYGPSQVHQWISAYDSYTRDRLHPTDTQRLIRAWEILRSTGYSMGWWQQCPGIAPLPYPLWGVRFKPERAPLTQAIERRFIHMIEQGAIEEVRHFRAHHPDPTIPVMRAHGVREILAYLDGKLSLEDVITLGVRGTRRYAKRQETWFSHHALTSPDRQCTFAHIYDKSNHIFDDIAQKFPFLHG